MRLLWIRHGQMEIRAREARDVAALNRLFSQEVQGSLTPRGRREAEQVALALAGRRVDALVASPLWRARETGEIAARRLGLDLEIDEDLVELRTGGLAAGTTGARLVDGLAQGPLPEGAKRLALSLLTVPLYYRGWQRGQTEGGESPAAFHGRMDRVVERLRARLAPNATAALFAHGYLIVSLSLRLARSPLERARIWRRPFIANGAITEIEVPVAGPPRLVRFADASHLSR